MTFFQKILTNFMSINPIQRQSLLSFGSFLTVTGLGFISTFYFAHYLGPAVLGVYFLFLAYYGIFVDLIGDGGFGGAAVKRISEGREQNDFFTAFVILRLALLCISIATFIVISPFLSGLQSDGLLYWLILALVAGSLATMTGSALHGTAQVGIMQVSNLFNTIMKNLVQILAVFIGCGVAGLVAGFVAGLITALLINYRFIPLSLSRCKRSHFTGLLSFSIWTFFSSGGLLIFTYADTILIGLFMSESDVGIYRVALQLTGVASVIVFVFHTVLYPRVSNWHAEKQFGMIEHSLTRAFTYSLFLAIPITAGGIILSEKLLFFFYGAAFESGAPTFIILLFVQIANVFMWLLTMCLNATDRPRASFIITAASGIINIVLNILLIPIFGISGAAIASLITISMNGVLAYGTLRSSLHISLDFRSVMNLVISATVMSLFLLGYNYLIPIQTFFSLILILTISAGIYFCTVIGIDKKIRKDLTEILVTMHLPGVS
ncbi:MAG: flippase [Smithella sp.]